MNELNTLLLVILKCTGTAVLLGLACVVLTFFIGMIVENIREVYETLNETKKRRRS